MFLLLFIGCKSTTKNEMETILFPQPSTAPLELSGLIEKQHFIRLETTTESLLGAINKVTVSDSLIFIKSNGAIFLFNSNGKFIRKIDKKGIGPNEYIRLSDFDVDIDKKELIIFDKEKKQLLSYDFHGNFISTISLDFWAIKFKKISKEHIILFSGNETSGDGQNYKFTLLSAQGSKQRFHVINEHKSGYLHVNTHQNFYENKSKHFFFEAFNDTVYLFDNDFKIKPEYHFSFAGKNIPNVFFEKQYSNIMEFFQAYRKTDYAYGISLFMETDQHIFTVYYVGGQPCYAVYNKKSKEAQSFSTIQDDLSLNNVALPPLDDDFQLWTYGNDLIYFMEADWLAERKQKIHSVQLNELSTNLNINDNPVMVISTVRQ